MQIDMCTCTYPVWNMTIYIIIHLILLFLLHSCEHTYTNNDSSLFHRCFHRISHCSTVPRFVPRHSLSLFSFLEGIARSTWLDEDRAGPWRPWIDGLVPQNGSPQCWKSEGKENNGRMMGKRCMKFRTPLYWAWNDIFGLTCAWIFVSGCYFEPVAVAPSGCWWSILSYGYCSYKELLTTQDQLPLAVRLVSVHGNRWYQDVTWFWNRSNIWSFMADGRVSRNIPTTCIHWLTDETVEISPQLVYNQVPRETIRMRKPSKTKKLDNADSWQGYVSGICTRRVQRDWLQICTWREWPSHRSSWAVLAGGLGWIHVWRQKIFGRLSNDQSHPKMEGWTAILWGASHWLGSG